MGLFDRKSKEEKQLAEQDKALERAIKEEEYNRTILAKLEEMLQHRIESARLRIYAETMRAKINNPDAEIKRLNEVRQDERQEEKEEAKQKKRRY